MSSELFSSFQIGKMLNVSRQAVNQWIDKGYIVSYRTPGGHRRVRRSDLLDFLRTRNIPLPEMLERNDFPQASTETIPRILILDDEDDFLTELQQAIKERIPTAQITTFSNGFDALVSIGANPPDLLILDLKMPKIDGFEICRRLKANERTSALPIMIVSAYEANEHERLLSLHVDEICSKSVPVGEIADRVVDFLREIVTTVPTA